MISYVTSEGVVVIEAENGTELFALKNVNKVLLVDGYRRSGQLYEIDKITGNISINMDCINYWVKEININGKISY